MQDFRNLKVWEKAHRLAMAIYEITREFPKGEAFGLTSQLRRCAVSIPSNIAEGCGRSGDRELARFLQIAGGSASELEYQLLLCLELGYIEKHSHDILEKRVQEVKRMIGTLVRSLRESATSMSPQPGHRDTTSQD